MAAAGDVRQRVDEVAVGLRISVMFDYVVSRKPSGGSRQSAKVRIGMLRRIAEPTAVPPRIERDQIGAQLRGLSW
jgi:hypothetical protein